MVLLNHEVLDIHPSLIMSAHKQHLAAMQQLCFSLLGDSQTQTMRKKNVHN